MTGYSILIPAAGASRRMRGKDKLLEMVDGQPLLRGVAERACGISEDVLVTVPDFENPRVPALQRLAVTCLDVPDAAEGMAASLRTAAPHMRNTSQGLMVLPSDMPDITSDDLKTLGAAFAAYDAKCIVQGTSADDTPGHPVIFPSDLVAQFADLTGDVGAKPILKANPHRIKRVALPDQNALTDLDTPEAWHRWREANPDR